jgi:hypothetical protein
MATSEDATPGCSVGNTIFLSQFGTKSIKQSYAAWIGKEMSNLILYLQDFNSKCINLHLVKNCFV